MEDRLQQCIDYLINVGRVSSSANFAERIGKQKSYVSEVLTGKRKISESFVHSITNIFPEISDRWLLGMDDPDKMSTLTRVFDRINFVLAREGLTKVDFAKGTGWIYLVCPAIYRNAEKHPGDIKVVAGWINCLIHLFPQYSERWLQTGEGQMLISGNDQTVVATAHKANTGIPLVPLEAFCGYGTPAFEDEQVEEYYQVKEFKQADFLMRLKGNSMYPKYSSGDIVACRLVKETLFFQWNKIYAIYTKSQGVMVKRVNQSSKEDCILLVSDNEKYAPFDVPLSDIQAIALVIGVIRVE